MKWTFMPIAFHETGIQDILLKTEVGTRQFSSLVFSCLVQTSKIISSRTQILHILTLQETKIGNALQCILAFLHCWASGFIACINLHISSPFLFRHMP